MTGSNCRHPACKAGALPAELIVHGGDPSGNRTRDTAVKGRCLNRLTKEPKWLRRKDLNQRPSGYEPDELPTAPLRVNINYLVPKTGIEPVRISLFAGF